MSSCLGTRSLMAIGWAVLAMACTPENPDDSGSTGGSSAGGNGAVGGNSSATGGVSSGGRSTGGSALSSGGASTGGKASGGASTGGTRPTGGTGAGGCQKGTKGNEVAVIGESFIAMSHGITQEIEKNAQAAGSLGANEHYVDNSVSGTTLANDQIPSQYRQAQASNNIRFVLMDGGGNDCLQANNPDGALSAAKSLFQTMTQDGVEAIVYFFYPDPVGSSYSSLKSCLDTLRPQMKALCDGLTAPKCNWLDLRPVWNGHNEYTSDGIHPTSAGSIATGDAIWEVMKANCVAQ